MLIVHNPITICEVKSKSGLVGYKVEPWLKTTREDMFIINMDNVLTLSESFDMEMIGMYQNFLQDFRRDAQNNTKLNRKMGYLATVKDAKKDLERIQKDFVSESLSEDETKSIIKEIYKDQGILIDPHTAVGVGAMKKQTQFGKTIVLATAHPSKFFETVMKQTGIKAELPEDLNSILDEKEKYEQLPKDLKNVQNYILNNVK